jgi:hypothetical protein
MEMKQVASRWRHEGIRMRVVDNRQQALANEVTQGSALCDRIHQKAGPVLRNVPDRKNDSRRELAVYPEEPARFPWQSAPHGTGEFLQVALQYGQRRQSHHVVLLVNARPSGHNGQLARSCPPPPDDGSTPNHGHL